MKQVVDTVLVVGLGSIGKRHVEIINQQFPQVKVVALRHRKYNDTEGSSQQMVKQVFSLDEAILTNPQAAIIANPATKHIAVAKALASHGVHLMVEKPISDNSKDSLELINICKENNVILMAAYNLRFLPSLSHFRQCIKSGLIGELLSVRSEVGQYLPSWRPESDYRVGVSAQKDLGGGVLLELSHEIDYLRWIFGEILWVQSHTSRQSDLEIDVNDSASIIMGMGNTIGESVIVSLNMDFIRHDTTRRCYAIGEKGTLLWDAISGEVKVFLQDEKIWNVLFQSLPDRNYTYTQEIVSFFDSIESGGAPSVTGEDGLKVVEVIEAAEKSSFINSRVDL